MHGIFSTDSIDSSGEIVDLGGIEISSLNKDAVANWEHNNDLPSQIIGKVLFAKKIFDIDDCENEEQLYFWNKIQRPLLYGIVELFDAEGHSEAKNLAAIARYSMKNKDKLFCPVLNFSVEGATLSQKGQKIKRSVARKVATTVKPCNKQAFAEILGWKPENAKKSLLINISKSEEQMAIFNSHLSILKKAVDHFADVAKMVKHTHEYKIDKKGNGKTTSTSAGPKHTHKIVDYKVQSGGKDNHRHPDLVSSKKSEINGTISKLKDSVKKVKSLNKDSQKYSTGLVDKNPRVSPKRSFRPLTPESQDLSQKRTGSEIKPKRIFTPSTAPKQMRVGDRIDYTGSKKQKTGSSIYGDSDTFKTEDMKKTLEAGSYDAMPSSLSQGAALQQEDLAGKVQDVGYSKKDSKYHKNRALAAYRDWKHNKKGKFKDYLKMEMPEVSDSFLQIFSDIVDKIHFKKTEQVIEHLYEISIDQFGWDLILEKFEATDIKRV